MIKIILFFKGITWNSHENFNNLLLVCYFAHAHFIQEVAGIINPGVVFSICAVYYFYQFVACGIVGVTQPVVCTKAYFFGQVQVVVFDGGAL